MRMTKLFGKNIEHVYSVKDNRQIKRTECGDDIVWFIAKPELKVKNEIVGWRPICEYEGDPAFNSLNSISSLNKVNISEKEEVLIEKEVFRADLNEYHLFTDKVLSEKDDNKEDGKECYEALVKKFNKSMILSNQEMKEHCDLYKLSYEDTDCELLFKKLFPGYTYKIVDGKMVKHESISATKIAYDPYKPLSNTNTRTITATSIINNDTCEISVKG